jgi:hypothetical protein
MVHALNELWRVLTPGGRLIDLRPRPANWPLELVANGRFTVVGNTDNAPFLEDDSAAEAAIHGIAHDGRFALEQKTSFDCLTYWDTLDDMLTYYRESPRRPPMYVPDDVQMRARKLEAASEESQVCIRYTLGLATYQKVVHP